MLLIDDSNLNELIVKEQEILSHPAWHDLLLGVDSEDLLRGKETFSYLLRAGEVRFHYYLSYVIETPFIYKHQPFAIALKNSSPGWGYRNGHNWWTTKLEELIPLILHQPADKCIPILRN